MVIFGVAGDLARSTLIPALYDLGCPGLLPEPFSPFLGRTATVGISDVLRQALLDVLRKRKGFRVDAWQKFGAVVCFL